MNQIYERIFLMVLGAILTYYLSLQLLEHVNTQDMNFDLEAKLGLEVFIGKPLDLTTHEMSIVNDVILPENIIVSLKDVQGIDDIKTDIIRTLFGTRDVLFKHAENTKGLLLYGPPGTGKTMLAQGIAKDANIPIVCFNVANIENKLFGESNKMISALFTLAEKIQPCVIFLDEIDCFGSTRNAMDQSHVNNMKAVMLTHMDGVSTKCNKNIFIGATNRIDSIDPALRRRIPIAIEIPLPDVSGIEQILSQQLNSEESVIHNIALLCRGLSCSDVKQLCNAVSTLYTSDMDLADCFKDHLYLVE